MYIYSDLVDHHLMNDLNLIFNFICFGMQNSSSSRNN